MTDDEALRAQRDAALQSLRDLEDEHAAGDLADADYLELKEEYTARAASVLRQLDANNTDPLPDAKVPQEGGSRPEASGGNRRKRRIRAVAVVGLLAIASGGIGFAVAESSGERLAGDEATGDLPETGVDRITRANALVSEGKILDAVKVYDEVLDDDPENPVALAQRGWLLSRVDPRLVDEGLAQVERALVLDPTYADAHFFRGMILLLGKNQAAAASDAFQQGIDANPDPDLRAILQQYKEKADEEAAAPTTTPSTTP